jgi:hypothetical protein
MLCLVLPVYLVLLSAPAPAPQPAQIALYYSGWQLVGQREDQPTLGDVNNVTRARELVARGFTHGMLSHGNDATLAAGPHGRATYGTNCSGWTPASRTCAARFLSANGLASYMTVGLNFHRFYEDPAKIPMSSRRMYSPFVNKTYHLLTLRQLRESLQAQSPWLAGAANDLEYGCWPPNRGIGNATAEQYQFPDLPERLGNAPSAMTADGWPSFTDWPVAGAHPLPSDAAGASQNWTLEQLFFNMPQPWSGVPSRRGGSRSGVVRVAGSPGGNVTRFAQLFTPPPHKAGQKLLARVDLWLRLSAPTTLPLMPYLSYFIAPLLPNGTPDLEHPVQCATLRPPDQRGGKWIKCGVSAKELPAAGSDVGDVGVGWQPMKLYFDPSETVLDSSRQYALVLENCPLNVCWLATEAASPGVPGTDAGTDYEIAVEDGAASSGGAPAMLFSEGSWRKLPGGVTATTVFYEPGSIKLGYTPNQLHEEWVAFHANTTANEIRELAAIARTIVAANSTNGHTLDVVAYSGFAGLGVYDPSSMTHYGDLREKYGVDWEVLSAAGLTVAMVGYGDHDIAPILRALAKGNAAPGNPAGKRCPLVCGVIAGTQAQFAQRYHACAAAQGGQGYIMEYDGHHTFDSDLGFHIPGFAPPYYHNARAVTDNPWWITG